MRTANSTPCAEPRRRLLAVAVVLRLSAPAAAQPSPRGVVQRTSDQVLAVLAEPGLGKADRREKVKAIVLANTDFDTLCRLVLARNWSRFSADQQREFQREFKDHLSATYGRRLDDYRGEKLAIEGDRKETNGDWTVQSRIVRGGGSNDVLVDYRLRQTDGQWRVIDVIIEQVSLVANFRSQFQEIIANGGPAKLLELLREKIAKGEEFQELRVPKQIVQMSLAACRASVSRGPMRSLSAIGAELGEEREPLLDLVHRAVTEPRCVGADRQPRRAQIEVVHGALAAELAPWIAERQAHECFVGSPTH